MVPLQILKLSQSRTVRVLDFILPIVALIVAGYYFFMAKDNVNGAIWLATAVLGFVLSIANITKLMHNFLIKRVAQRK